MGTREARKGTPISAAAPPWIELPDDVTANILERLGTEEIFKSAEKVCSRWSNFCRGHYPGMWRVVHLENQPGGDEGEFDVMCRCAVDRSQGQLIELRISGFGGGELLNYVAHRSGGSLRRLALEYTENISGCALTAAIKRLPQLEELHLYEAFLRLSAEDVETIGISCPLLKSFEHSEDGIALAIAKTMPNLHHLRLGGKVMDNEGLEAILDGCPHLESLDIFICTGLNLLDSDLAQRCSNQIKHLRFPFGEVDLIRIFQRNNISRSFLDALQYGYR